MLRHHLYYNIAKMTSQSNIHVYSSTMSHPFHGTDTQYVSLSLDVILASLPVPVLGSAHKYFGPEECFFCKSSALNKAKARQTKEG